MTVQGAYSRFGSDARHADFMAVQMLRLVFLSSQFVRPQLTWHNTLWLPLWAANWFAPIACPMRYYMNDNLAMRVSL